MLLALSIAGCCADPYVVRPSIEELMQEALDVSERNPEIMNPSEMVLESDQQWIEEAPHQQWQHQYGDEDVYGVVPTQALEPLADGSQLEEVPLPEDEDAVLISEEFIETDIREALLVVAAQAEADIVMDDQVRGVVNTTITEAPFDEALEKLLLPLGLEFAKRGDRYLIGPPDPKSPMFHLIAQHLEFRPQHVDAKNLIGSVPREMVGYVRLMGGSNVVVIDAPPRHCKMILERFHSLDVAAPQVELEAIICVVSPDQSHRFGLDWSHALELNGQTALKFGVNGMAISAASTPAGLNSAFSDYATTSAFVRLMAEHGYLAIRAAPRVMAQDGKQANITIGRETFFTVQPNNTSTGDSNAFFFQQDIQKVESGISLDITPKVRGDSITIEIEKAEVSEDIRTSNSDLASNAFPIINRRSVSTTVHIKDRKTVVIGGLVQKETVDRSNSVPGLSSLPGVGYLFKSNEQQSREAEVVIFISPRIVRPEGCAPCLVSKQPPGTNNPPMAIRK